MYSNDSNEDEDSSSSNGELKKGTGTKEKTVLSSLSVLYYEVNKILVDASRPTIHSA